MGDDLLTPVSFDPDSNGALNALVFVVPPRCSSCGSTEYTAWCWLQLRAVPMLSPLLVSPASSSIFQSGFSAADLAAGSWMGNSQVLPGLAQVWFWDINQQLLLIKQYN